MSLPRRLHFVWIGGERPSWAARNIDQFRRLNPSHEIMIHGEEVLLPELASAYEGCQHLCSRADLLRLSALRRFGGWYFDCDFWPFRSLDDAARAWALDGSRVFISRQQGHKSGDKLPYANAPMACAEDAPGLWSLISRAASLPPRGRVGYGPRLVMEAIAEHPEFFEVADAPWYFPLSIEEAPAAYERLVFDHRSSLALRSPSTGGQMPFAAHLWAHANGEQIAVPRRDRPLAVVQYVDRSDHPLNAAAAGLEAVGYEVLRSRWPEQIGRRPDVVVCWNGIRRAQWVDKPREWGARVLIIEHGFFDRQRFSQVDHEGILHCASWRRLLRQPAPACGADRLAAHYPQGLRQMRPRRDGYVLVLGQVPGDTQMRDSEIATPKDLCRHIAAVMPQGQRVYVRPHPSIANGKHQAHLGGLPVLPVDRSEAGLYRSTKQGGGLAEAMEGARFVVAINSNALVEATAAGIPCAAFGPMLGIEAGAIRQMTVATLAADLRAMLDGWAPDQDTATNYLRWLAARQWSLEELAAGTVLVDLLAAADPVLEAV